MRPPATGERLRSRAKVLPEWDSNIGIAIELANLDADPQPEIALASGGTVRILDAASGQVERSSEVGAASPGLPSPTSASSWAGVIGLMWSPPIRAWKS
jgi:hypothetical protein